MYDFALKNGFVVRPEGIERAHVYITHGKIAAVTTDDLPAMTTEDATGKYLLPGAIDTHCHFRDPGATHKGDFEHETQAAAAGGVTTIFDMPNTNPSVLDAKSFAWKRDYLTPKAHVDFALWGLSLGHLNLSSLAELREAGAPAVKFFWGYAINAKTKTLIYNYDPDAEDIIPPLDDGEVYEIFEQIAENGQILAIHAENSELIHTLTARNAQAGGTDYRALLASRPALAEELTVQTALSFSRATGARLHILHVTSARGVELIRRAKTEGVPVTAETCPQYLFLSADDYDKVGSMMKVYPVVKEESDRQALWKGLLDGTLDFVASDHAPHTIAEKQGSLFEIPSGMCGVETMLPLLLGEAAKGQITLPFVARVLAENAARIYHLPQKGRIEADRDADITVVDMTLEKPIRNEDLHSKQPLTAFDGRIVRGWPVQTYLRGRCIARDGVIVDGGAQGRCVTPLRA